jgi:ribosomal protein S18 acetylase RimI-like enzyme
MVQIQLATSVEELVGILALQQANLRKNVSEEEALTQGFLMAEYDLEFLQALHAKSPSIIAKEGDQVVGYSIVALPEEAKEHDLLADLVRNIERCRYNNEEIHNYAIVGQLCVSKDYRGQGLVQQLYGAFRDHYAETYPYCVTDVAQTNARSLKAHQKRGFQVIDSLEYGGIGWDIVLWDWNKKAAQESQTA